MSKDQIIEIPEETIEDEFAVRREKRQKLIDNNINPYPHIYKKEISLSGIKNTFATVTKEAPTEEIVITAGRIIAKRGHGKASFANIADSTDTMQIYARKDVLGDESYEIYSMLDLGDIIGVSGVPFITNTGELTIKISSFILLSKALNPLPEKFHGLQDKELRYRKRYLDLISNPEIKNVFRKRSQIISSIRKYLENQEFMEVETPVLHSIAGGANAKPFITHHNALDMKFYLRIALELHLKRLIVGGFDKVFEIGRVFRNEGISYKHNPEYTLLELYQAYADYKDMMSLTENLLGSLAKELTGSEKVQYGDVVLDFKPPFARMTMAEVIEKYSGVNINKHDFDSLKKELKSKKISVDETLTTKGQLINLVYDKMVEHNIIQPTFITDYPLETSPLAKKHRDNPALVERFELIVNTLEIANAYSELNDPIDQRERFEEQLVQREAGDEEAHMMDSDFIESLEYGMPPTGGLGIGIDRVVMLLTNSPSIRDVLLFPHMRHK
ncbi:MAG: lysine--tRNA ligase [Candidatus Margulisbacteria bacterium GWF2_35_9]|nr:MAG: lysine--tRNA ligase [Candidatus Margulisbacteria bacterium GWF2_35_9]